MKCVTAVVAPSQAQALDRCLEQHGGPIRAAVYLEVPEDELVKRQVARGELSGRIDDRPDTARRRLEVFSEELPPVLEHYRARGLLRSVDGAQPIDDVQRQITEAIG
jgi:adenylate kinase